MSVVMIGERIGTLRQVNDLSARQLAGLVGVAPSTITRVEAGERQPTFDLAAAILMVLGETLTYDRSADPAAIAAARLAVDRGLPIPVSDEIAEWWRRWARIGLVSDEGVVQPGRTADLLFRAATVARLARRVGAIAYDYLGDWTIVADRLAGSGVQWALTGDGAANAYYPSASASWPVFYVSDLRNAERATGLVRRVGVSGRRITLIPFDGVSEADRTEVDGVWLASRWQVALDCYGGIGRMREQADRLMGVESR
jgi:transcriptional regulator with XRE-family HTH domain